VKSPKIFLRDSGLLHALLGISSYEDLLRHPLAGASWEGFVIEQLLGSLAAQGFAAEPSFFRTSDGYEIDLLLRLGTALVALEIKLSARASPDDVARLDRCADLVKAEHRYIVCQTNAPVLAGNRGVLHLPAALERLDALAGATRSPRRRTGTRATAKK
jgi:predicted AAA+ superfamily ATPase